MSLSASNEIPPVVTAEWLKTELDKDGSKVRVLDVTWASNKDSYEEYKKCHIPGANHFNIMHEAKHTDILPRNIPDLSEFEKYARSLGINADSHVIVYDATPLGGFFIGSRAWWMFKLHGHDRVSVLDGGLQKWIEGGYPTSDVEPKCEEGNFKASLQTQFIKKYEEMTENVNKGFQVLDSRPESTFNGNVGEARTGHYPGAHNFPFKAKLLNGDGSSLRTKEELSTAFREAGIDLSRPVVTMCNSGMSSCSLALAAHICGATDFAVYLGGFTEWRNKAADDLIVQTEEKA